MPCYGCTAQFGILKKEHGCPACGFSFCSNCLKFKSPVPKLGDTVRKVCKSCSEKSNDKDPNREGTFVPLDIRRLETLETPSKPPITIYHDKPRHQQLLKGLNSTDLEIARRLKKLRDERRNVEHIPTEDEIASRLAKLRDQEPNQAPPNVYFTSETRSVVEQTDNLLKQTTEQISLDSSLPDPDANIANRLRRLREQSNLKCQPNVSSKSTESDSITLDEVAQLLAQCKIEAGKGVSGPDLATIVSLEQLRVRLTQQRDQMEESSASEDESSAAGKIIAKATAEVEMEQRLGINLDDSDNMDEDTGKAEDDKELPWCTICNEDAKVRCLGCDGDLYCKGCFQQGHKDSDMRDHAYEIFKKH